MTSYWEIVLAVSMFFGGGIGTMATLYLSRIAQTLDKQIELVRDIDKRVVKVETRIQGLNL